MLSEVHIFGSPGDPICTPQAGLPRSVKAELERFLQKEVDDRKAAEDLARSLGFSLD